MKTRILFRIIAMVLVAIMCLGIAACGTTGTDDKETTDTGADTTAADNGGTGTTASTDAETSGTGNKTPTSSLDEEGMFAELLKAIKATSDYNGAITMDIVQSQSEKEGEDEMSIDVSGSMAIDPENNLYFVSSNTVRPGRGGYLVDVKVFEKDGVFYEYEYAKAYEKDPTEAGEESIYLDPVPEEFSISDEYGDQFEMIEPAIGGVAKAENYKALTDAHSKVFADVKEKELAEFKAMGGYTDASTFTMEPEVSIKQENGEIVLTIIARSTVTAVADSADGEGEYLKEYACTIIRNIACKDGKISRVSVSADMVADMLSSAPGVKPEEEVESMKIGLGYVMDYKFSYAFDKAGFDAIEVKTPIAEEEKDEFDYPTVYVHLGDSLRLWTSFDESQTVEQYIEYVGNQIKWSYGSSSVQDPSGEWTDVPAISVNGLYKDAALTQKIDPATITREEILALGEIYADYTIADGFAIVVENYSTAEEYSLDYQIVLYDFYGAYRYEDSAKEGRVVRITEPLEFDIDEGGSGTQRILVNGNVLSGNTVTLESGKTYNIEHVHVYTDADFDAIDLFSDLFPN